MDKNSIFKFHGQTSLWLDKWVIGLVMEGTPFLLLILKKTYAEVKPEEPHGFLPSPHTQTIQYKR